ncbi:MAG TPA: hypothetical protein VN108_08250 [Marmoricola sp.]|nr:hypothetical protein [Marmoricola sp.]
MGVIKRAARRREMAYWGRLSLALGEEPIDYANLLADWADDGDPGTLYLTSRRVVWISADGTRADIDLAWFDGCRGALRGSLQGWEVAFRPDGGDAQVTLAFFPSMPKVRANRMLAERFFNTAAEALCKAHPDWQS